MAEKSCKFYKDVFVNGYFKGLDRLFDGTVISEDGMEFKIHKLILSKGSEYFQAFYRCTFAEKRVIIPGLDGETLENILLYLYTGEVLLDEDNIADMMIAADYLLVDPLLMQCRYFAVHNITLKSCIPLLSASWMVERLGIVNSCYRFVLIHFGSIVHLYDSHIAELPLNALKKLLQDDSLGVNSEEVVWKAIEAWVSGHFSDRLQYVPELLSYLRLRPLSSSLLSHNCSLFKGNCLCKELNGEKQVETSNMVAQNSLKVSYLSERSPRRMYLIMCRASVRNLDNGSDIFLTYDGQLDIWRKIGETYINFHILVPINQFVFMFNVISNTIQEFDLKEKTWRTPKHPTTPRQGYNVVKSKDRVYVVGGSISMSPTRLCDVEYYQATADLWIYTSALPSVDVSGIAILNDKLYVIGFLEEFERLVMKALVYEPLFDFWNDIEIPKQFRTHFAIASFQDKIYVLGGQTERNDITTSVEFYDPTQDDWEIFPDLPAPYTLPQAIILNDKLMVYEDQVGGRAIARFFPSVWNEETQSWEMLDIFSPFNQIHRYLFCPIEDPLILNELMKENRNPGIEWKKSPFAAY